MHLRRDLDKFYFKCYCFIYCLGQTLVQDGKINFTASYPDLLYCANVQFPRAFSSSRNVRVITSISYESNARSVHDSAVVWTSDVTKSSFRVCILESGPGTNGSAVVNWIAFRSAPSGMLDGTASLSAFTSGTKCERVTFAQVVSQKRTLFLKIKKGFAENV